MKPIDKHMGKLACLLLAKGFTLFVDKDGILNVVKRDTAVGPIVLRVQGVAPHRSAEMASACVLRFNKIELEEMGKRKERADGEAKGGAAGGPVDPGVDNGTSHADAGPSQAPQPTLDGQYPA